MTQKQTESSVSEMFNDISKKYDRANRILSLGIDKGWRKMMRDALPDKTNLRLLDLATGTADQLLSLMESGKIGYGLGLDIAEEMVKIGQQKVEKSPYSDLIELKVASALSIPEEAASFDCVTISFGIRNVEDPATALKEMHRVLAPSGRALILEFSLPKNLFVRTFHLLYLRHLLPTIGGMIAGKKSAYRYLNETIEAFPYGEAFTKLMEEAGFVEVEAKPLTFGIATLYIGEKP